MSALVVLVVDDDARNRKLARDVLGLAGIETLEAATAEEGIACAKRSLPGLVLLDLRLPDLDGIAAMRRLKDDPATAGIPVVALTALGGARAALIAAGFDDCLEKPIDVTGFPAQVRALAARGGSPPREREAGTLD